MTENALDLFYRHSFIDGHSGESTTEFVRMYPVHSNALADCSESDFNSADWAWIVRRKVLGLCQLGCQGTAVDGFWLWH